MKLSEAVDELWTLNRMCEELAPTLKKEVLETGFEVRGQRTTVQMYEHGGRRFIVEVPRKGASPHGVEFSPLPQIDGRLCVRYCDAMHRVYRITERIIDTLWKDGRLGHRTILLGDGRFSRISIDNNYMIRVESVAGKVAEDDIELEPPCDSDLQRQFDYCHPGRSETGVGKCDKEDDALPLTKGKP